MGLLCTDSPLRGESKLAELRSDLKRRLLKYDSLAVELDQLTDEYDNQVDMNYQLEKGNLLINQLGI